MEPLRLLRRLAILLLVAPMTGAGAASGEEGLRMERVNVVLDGQPAGVLPEMMVKDGDVRVPLGHFCAAIGAKVETQGGQVVVCSGDLCVPVEPTGSADRGDLVFVSLAALGDPLGLRWEFLKERGELRVTTRRSAKVDLRAGDRAPDFTLPDLSGRPASLRDFRGQRAVFYVWASW